MNYARAILRDESSAPRSGPPVAVAGSCAMRGAASYLPEILGFCRSQRCVQTQRNEIACPLGEIDMSLVTRARFMGRSMATRKVVTYRRDNFTGCVRTGSRENAGLRRSRTLDRTRDPSVSATQQRRTSRFCGSKLRGDGRPNRPFVGDPFHPPSIRTCGDSRTALRERPRGGRLLGNHPDGCARPAYSSQ